MSDLVARNLKDLRAKHDFTQEDLAREAGLHRVTIAAIEGARYEDQQVSTLEALAKALGEPVSAFFEGRPGR